MKNDDRLYLYWKKRRRVMRGIWEGEMRQVMWNRNERRKEQKAKRERKVREAKRERQRERGK